MCWKQNLRIWHLKKRTLASQEICLYKILLDSRTFYQCMTAQHYLAFMQQFVKYFTHTKMRFFVSSHHFFFLHFLSKFQLPIFPHQPTNRPCKWFSYSHYFWHCKRIGWLRKTMDYKCWMCDVPRKEGVSEGTAWGRRSIIEMHPKITRVKCMKSSKSDIP